jgi:galactonate dehydratase
LRGYASHWLQGADTPEKAFEGAREAIRRGFSAFKCRPFSFEGLRDNTAAEVRKAAALMEAAREGAGPDADIYIECSEFLSPRTAVIMDEALHPYRPGSFEEPIPFENAKVMVPAARYQDTDATGERLLSRFEYRELLETAVAVSSSPT